MHFRKFVEAIQTCLPVNEEAVAADGELGVPDAEEHPSPEDAVAATVSEMAVATAPGVKLTRIKDEKYKNYDMSGMHNISVDGEHVGVIDKRRGEFNSYKSSGHHYVIKPTVEGHFNSGSWKPLTPAELGKYHANPDDHGMNIHTGANGELQRYTTDTTDADHKFPNHDTHEKGFDSQQAAVDYIGRAHRMSKEFPGGAKDRYAEAHDVKERYLQGEAHANKAREVRNHLLQAAWAAKKSYPDHPDLLKSIEAIHGHHAIKDDGMQAEHHQRFRDLTYDLPRHSWSSTDKDPHENLRDINKAWKV